MQVWQTEKKRILVQTRACDTSTVPVIITVLRDVRQTDASGQLVQSLQQLIQRQQSSTLLWRFSSLRRI